MEAAVDIERVSKTRLEVVSTNSCNISTGTDIDNFRTLGLVVLRVGHDNSEDLNSRSRYASTRQLSNTGATMPYIHMVG